MSSKAIWAWAVLLLPGADSSQQVPPPLSAKTLYYQGQSADEDLPVQSEQKQPQETKTTPPKHADKSPDGRQTGVQTEPRQNAARPILTSAVQHLGLRYNIALIDRKSHQAVSVDRDRLFQPGECIQLEFSPNRSGYLYVFEQGSSGRWQVLFPSALMSDEINVVRAREPVQVPSKYCFRIDNPPGTEHLFVVLSRNQEDIYSLNRAVRASSQSPAAPQTDRSSPPLATENKLDAEIERMKAELGAKDMSIEKIGEPDRAGEPADSVYLVNASSVPSDRLVSEILIRHP